MAFPMLGSSLGGVLKVSNEVPSLIRFLEASKHHLGARDVLFGVL